MGRAVGYPARRAPHPLRVDSPPTPPDRSQPGPADSKARPDRPGVVVIASPSDLLAQLVATSLLYAHVPTCQLDPAKLAEVELEWHGDQVTINGQPICGLLWRAPPRTGIARSPSHCQLAGSCELSLDAGGERLRPDRLAAGRRLVRVEGPTG